MTLALLPADPLEIVHFRGRDGCPDELQSIQLRLLSAALVVLDEHLDVLNILELYVSQIY